MIVFLDTSEALDVCAAEMGLPRGSVKQLITPRSCLRQKENDEFAIDNGAFANFDQQRFRGLLEREREVKHLCKFVVVPDVVGNARRTLEVFEHWKYELNTWPLAFALQDGIESFPIPWKHIHAIFIGGTTDFKLGDKPKPIIQAAKAMGKWVHAGRVNTPLRFEYFEALGVDSMDGTGLSRFSWMRTKFAQPSLLADCDVEVK